MGRNLNENEYKNILVYLEFPIYFSPKVNYNGMYSHEKADAAAGYIFDTYVDAASFTFLS